MPQEIISTQVIPPADNTCKILIVDDEPFNLIVLESLLHEFKLVNV